MLLDLLIALLVSAYTTLFLVVWRSMGVVEYADGLAAVLPVLNEHHLIAFLGLIVISFMTLRICRRSGNRIADFVYKWRYVIGAVFVIVMVALKVSGSSVHIWADYLGGSSNGVFFGRSRPIRSDEWALNTPMAFAQAASGFNYFSPVIGAGLDAFIVYGQPVLDIAAIFRPFHWGYLLLGAEAGLAFFWMARLVALVLISFDLGMLILDNKRGLSLMLSLMIAFAPFVQWWFAINGLVEMLVFGFSAVLVFNQYLQTSDYGRRARYGVIVAWLGISYILTFYPAWLVPISYVMLALVIWTVIRNRKTMRLTGKDALVLLETIVLMALGLGYVFFKSKDTIKLVMNTVYPGRRVGMDTISIWSLFTYPIGLFSAFRGDIPNSNVCEAASFISFFPLGLVLFAFNSLRRRKIDALSAGLVIVSVFLGLYCFAGFNETLLNISLMRFSMAGRALPILMMAQMLLLFREMAIARDSVKWGYGILLTLIISVAVPYAAHVYLGVYYTAEMLAIVFALTLSVSLAAFFIGNNRYMANLLWVCVASVTVIGGLFVNPVQVGSSEITDNPVTRLVKPIVEESKDACWLVENSYPIINSIMVVGARTLNSTNVYPHMDLWKKIDRDGAYEDVYNRYAHISVKLVGEETCFENGIAPDQFVLKLNPDDLPKLGVDYILTENNLQKLNTESVRFDRVARQGDYKVYRVWYEKSDVDPGMDGSDG